MVRKMKINSQHQRIDNEGFDTILEVAMFKERVNHPNLGSNNTILVSLLSHLPIVHPEIHGMGFLSQMSL